MLKIGCPKSKLRAETKTASSKAQLGHFVITNKSKQQLNKNRYTDSTNVTELMLPLQKGKEKTDS